MQAFLTRGIQVVVTFPTGAEARPGDTPVIYQGVTVGHVVKVAFAPDHQHVDFTLDLQRSLVSFLRDGTQFWMVGATTSLTDLSSLKAAISGLSIGMAPGPGNPARRFNGSLEQPAVLPGVRGTRFLLTTDRLGAIRVGTGIYYRGLEVGKVEKGELARPGVFRLTAFVRAPFDHTVTTRTAFWKAAAFKVSFDAQGLTTRFNSAQEALGGGIEFDGLTDAVAPPAAANTLFPVYSVRDLAEAGPAGPEVLYRLHLGDRAGQLVVGAPVTFRGFQIGEIKRKSLSFDLDTGRASSPVVVAINPERLHPTSRQALSSLADRGVSDRVVNQLLAAGYRAQLVQSPPFIGGWSVALARIPGVGHAGLQPDDPYPAIPVTNSAGLDDVTDKASTLLDTLNRLPLAAIGADVHRLLGQMNSLAASPKLAGSLEHLDGVLGQLDATLKEVRPQVPVLIDRLNHAADALQKTAASAETVLSGAGGDPDASLPGP